jgi:ubiquinone/menaquinone biosynthesis C-methylase UbiE
MNEQLPFDHMAESYDADFSSSRIGRMQRNKVWSMLSAFSERKRGPLSILEINCGTGEDAIHLAELGHHVIATDASAVMIEKAKQKADSLQIDNALIQFIQCPFDQLAFQFAGKQFDLVFSDFGGINCVQAKAIHALAADLSQLLIADGQLVLVAMGRFCLWETAYFMYKRRFAEAFRRWKKKNLLEAGGKSMPFYHYSPAGLQRLFHPYFNRIKYFPVGLLIPPSYLEQQFLSRSEWLHRLDQWESRLNRHSLFSNLSDHFYIIFNRGTA